MEIPANLDDQHLAVYRFSRDQSLQSCINLKHLLHGGAYTDEMDSTQQA